MPMQGTAPTRFDLSSARHQNEKQTQAQQVCRDAICQPFLRLDEVALRLSHAIGPGTEKVQHEHAQEQDPHVHIHGTHAEDEDAAVERSHGFFHFGKPFFRVKSFTIGVVHGLAGSAAVMLVLLPTLPSFWAGIGYLALFGVGTMVSMAMVTLLLGVPFAITGSFERVNRAVSGVAGTASAVFGVALMSDILLGTGLIPF